MLPARRFLSVRARHLRHQQSSLCAFRRNASTNAEAVSPAESSSTSSSTNAAPRKPRVSLRPYIWATAFFALGLTGGQFVRYVIAPPPFPIPGSEEDQAIVAKITKDIDALPIVQKLRSLTFHQQSGVKPQDSLSSRDDDERTAWQEILVDHLADQENAVTVSSVAKADANDTTVPGPAKEDTRTLTKTSLMGGRGLGVQRVFWNSATRELVAAVWVGPALSGWPGVAHGGVLATLLKEAMIRGLVGPEHSLDILSDPSTYALDYVKPTNANGFYVLRATIGKRPSEMPSVPENPESKASSWWSLISPTKDMTKRPQHPDVPSIEMNGTLENLEGKVCVKARATWPVASVPAHALT